MRLHKVASECDALRHEVAIGAKRLKEEEHKVESVLFLVGLVFCTVPLDRGSFESQVAVLGFEM